MDSMGLVLCFVLVLATLIHCMDNRDGGDDDWF